MVDKDDHAAKQEVAEDKGECPCRLISGPDYLQEEVDPALHADQHRLYEALV